MLFELSYDYVGDLSETVALMWPVIPPPQGEGGQRSEAGGVATASPHPAASPPPSPFRGGMKQTPTLTHVVTTLASLGKSELPAQLAAWLDALDETGRWALLKLVTGALRIGVSARLAKTAVAALGGKEPDEVELVWPGLAPPYAELFAWIEGRAEKPVSIDPAPFRPVMLSHAIEETGFSRARSRALRRRMEMGRHPRAGGRRRSRRQARRAALFAHRRGHFRRVSRSHRGADLRRRDRRRAADHARRPRAVVQRAAAAAQPQNREREAARRISRASARLRSARRRRRGPARAAVRASAARGSKR